MSKDYAKLIKMQTKKRMDMAPYFSKFAFSELEKTLANCKQHLKDRNSSLDEFMYWVDMNRMIEKAIALKISMQGGDTNE